MTVAVCFKCGHIKFGALCPCDKCDTAPLSAEEKSLSMILTEIYLKGDEMDKYSKLIKGGTIVSLDKKTEDMWIDHFRDKDMPSKKTDDMRIDNFNEDEDCLP